MKHFGCANKVEAIRAESISRHHSGDAVESLEKARIVRRSWVDREMETLIGQSEQLAALAVGRSVSQEWAEHEDDTSTRLKGRIVACEKLAKRLESEVIPAIELRENHVGKLRPNQDRKPAQIASRRNP